MAGSMRLTASTSTESATNRPSALAWRLMRPVAAGDRRRASCGRASAISAAASSSPISPAPAGDDHLLQARLGKGAEFGLAEHGPLGEPPCRKRHRMGEPGTAGITQRNRTELHGAEPARAASAGLRSVAISCARIATAISAGVAAPIGRPIGAAIWSISSVAKPEACSRETRAACVFRLPSAPI